MTSICIIREMGNAKNLILWRQFEALMTKLRSVNATVMSSSSTRQNELFLCPNTLPTLLYARYKVKLKKVTWTYTLFEYKILQNNFQGTTHSQLHPLEQTHYLLRCHHIHTSPSRIPPIAANRGYLEQPQKSLTSHQKS